jgi:hypothetical protein
MIGDSGTILRGERGEKERRGKRDRERGEERERKRERKKESRVVTNNPNLVWRARESVDSCSRSESKVIRGHRAVSRVPATAETPIKRQSGRCQRQEAKERGAVRSL